MLNLKNLIWPLLKKNESDIIYEYYEYCPRCGANLTLQKGYDNLAPYWICKGCGEMLINPSLETFSDIIWRCDKCGDLLNIQDGFNEDLNEWKCNKCGNLNRIDISELYLSENEYNKEKMSPYRGLSGDTVLKLSEYTEEKEIKENVLLIRNEENKKLYIKKYLYEYERSIYEFLKESPIAHIPRVIEAYESENCLIVIEEYIEGENLFNRLKRGVLSEKEAIYIGSSLALIISSLQDINPPIIHRDIKPSNVLISKENEIFLLDLNIGKWYDQKEREDKKRLGTLGFAAPEQAGFGNALSSLKTDVYAMGQLLNVMLTGKNVREELYKGRIGSLIKMCVSLDEKDRPTIKELYDILKSF